MRPMRITALAALALLAAGCAAAPGPVYHLLDAGPAAPAAPAAPSAPLRDAAPLGLREIALPLYARRQQMAALDADGAVTLSDDQRWAEEPPRAATRLLARALAARTGAPTVVEPWPLEAAPYAVLAVEVDRFIGAPGGTLRLEGQMTVAPAARGAGARTESFAIETPVAPGGFPALAAAHAAALEALADRAAASLPPR